MDVFEETLDQVNILSPPSPLGGRMLTWFRIQIFSQSEYSFFECWDGGS